MTQRAQKQRVHDDSPAKLRKDLDQKERRYVPEVTPREERDLWCVSEGEECDGEGGQQ